MKNKNIFILYITILIIFFFHLTSYQLNAQTSQIDSSKITAATSEIDTSESLTQSIQKTTPNIEWNVSASKIIWSLIIFLIALFVIRYLSRIFETIGEKWTNLRLVIKRIIPIFRISIWTFVIYIIIAGIIAPPIETLIAVTASAGIAIGFASQDILKNIFGGIMILFDRPFQVGDKIQVGEHYGEVVQIGLRTVRVVTPDDSLVSIPNSEIVNESVSNSNSGEFNCQVVSEFYLPTNIDLIRLKKIAYRAAAVSRYVYLKKPIAVILKNEIHEGQSLLKMRLKAYVLDLRYEFAFASEMTEFVIQQLLKEEMITGDMISFMRKNN